MASSFMGLYVQREGLLIAQKALDITGNNISNINTPGYSRQRVDVCSVANGVGTLGYNTAVSLAGRGVDVIGVAQIRDRLVDNKVRMYSGDFCNVGIKTSVLSDVEDVFDSIEADELNASFASIISKMKAALEGFSADNADRSEMANISLNAAKSVVQCVVNYNSKLNDISEQVLSDTKKTVSRINKIFAEMGTLNKQIKDSYVSMNYFTSSTGNYEVMNDYGPLELKDEMNKLIDELAQYGNVYVKEESDGTFTVDFADRRVVEDRYYAQMALTKQDPKPTEMGFEISKNLMDKDDWYALNVKYGTGGNADVLVREHQDDAMIGGTVDITDLNTDGKYKLDKGSLRGYLDVYNGRGIYANGVNTAMEQVNVALQGLKTLNAKKPLTDPNEIRQAEEYIKTLENNMNATVTGDKTTGWTVTVPMNGTNVSVLDASNNAALIQKNGNVLINGTLATGIDYNEIGGERGAATVQDALDNVAKINKEINKLTDRLDNGASQNAATVNTDLTKLANYNTELAGGGSTTLTPEEATALAKEIVKLMPEAVLEGDSATGFAIKKKDGTPLLNGGTAATVTAADTPLSEATKAALVTQRVEAYEKAQKYVGILKDCKQLDVTNANNSNGLPFEVTVKGTTQNLLDPASNYESAFTVKAEPKIEIAMNGTKQQFNMDDADGTLKEYIEFFKNNPDIYPNAYSGIEYYRDMLNSFVKTMTDELNGIYSDPSFNNGKGWQLFTYENDDGNSEFRTAAEFFRVADDWNKNPMVIANPSGDNKWEELDNYYINKMLGVFSVDLEYGDGTIKDPLKFSVEKFVGHICDDLGDKLAEEKGVYDATDVMLSSAEKIRSEKMDVSMDEEGINMMNYQKWYNAIARMVTTLDEALDKLINGTGLVGLR